MNAESVLKVCKVLFLVLFFASLIFYTGYNITDRSNDETVVEAEKLEDWTVCYPDGREVPCTDPYAEEPKDGEPYVLKTNLPDIIEGDHFLCFLVLQDTEVSVDGKLRMDLINARDVHLIGGAVKASYLIVPIAGEDAGKELTITRVRGNTEKRVYPTTLFGTPKEIYWYMMDVYVPSFVMYLVLLAISFLIVMAGVILAIRLHRSISMLYAGFAVLITTAWMISDSFLYPLVFKHYYIDGVISYLLCMLIPMPFLIYMNGLQHGRYAKWYAILQTVTAASFILWTCLHFTGVFAFHNSLPYLDTILALVIVACVVITIIDIVHGNVREYLYTAVGFLGFSILSFLQIIVIFTMDLNNDGVLLLFGLLFMLICVVLQQLHDLAAADREKRRAMELSDAKTRFLASMSHEIRTPINSILGMNEMILRENHDRTINSYARNVQNAGKMLLALINDVLDFSKIEAGKLEITNAEYSLSELLSEIVLIAGERAAAKNLTFTLNIADNVPDGLYSDEVRIKQILLNLLSNAVKYTDAGEIILAVSGAYESDDAYRLQFKVQDSGRGIREEELDGLFDAFSRADLAANRNVEGTGLGLAIVKSIVDSMGGEVFVASTFGEGSVFTVRLPQRVTDRKPVSVHPEDKKAAGDMRDYRSSFTAPEARVLAVDDNATNLSIVKQFLKNTGVHLDCCMSGGEAIGMCTSVVYDLILLDHMMPDPDGIETLARIRSDSRSLNRDTKAVVLTANAVVGSREMYLNAGFVDYLTKPLDSALLERTVRKYLPEDKIMEERNEQTEEPVQEQTGIRWDEIEEVDHNTAMIYCGTEEVLTLVAEEIADSHEPIIEKMRAAYSARDHKTYQINAHTIKSNMATIGATALSERAKKHEYAGRDSDWDFIEEDMEGFLTAFAQICAKIRNGSRQYP